MFAGFNLTLNSMDLIELSAYKEQGDQLFKEQKKEIVAALEKYINVDGSLEASKIDLQFLVQTLPIIKNVAV